MKQEAKTTVKKTRRNTILTALAGALIVAAGVGIAVLTLSRHSEAQTPVLEGLDILCAPSDIVINGDGFLITDTYGKKVWYVEHGKGTVYAGADSVKDLYQEPLGGYNDASYAEALFKEPWAITPFLGGFAVSDPDNHAIRLLKSGKVQTINGSSDELESADLGVTFDCPTGLATDADGNLYVADTERGTVYTISVKGVVDTAVEGLVRPMGLCWENSVLYIAETGANRVCKLENGALTVIAGNGTEGDADGSALSAQFSSPMGVVCGPDGSIYISDTVNGKVKRLRGGNVETIYEMTGSSLQTYPVSTMGMCISGANLYVCDRFSRKVYALPL